MRAPVALLLLLSACSDRAPVPDTPVRVVAGTATSRPTSPTSAPTPTPTIAPAALPLPPAPAIGTGMVVQGQFTAKPLPPELSHLDGLGRAESNKREEKTP